MAKAITLDELKNLIDKGEDFTLLDVRDTPEYEKKHIIYARHMLISEMDEKSMSIFSKDKLVVTYSEDFNCPASTIAAEKLEGLGFTDVMDYKGSYKEWLEAGYPLK
ncbi:rhodanese-like domain-containing protein [Spirochaetota bacterium]